MLSTLNLDLLPKPDKTQVEIKYLVYDNMMEDLDYYYLYLSIHNVIDSLLDNDKQILSNLIYNFFCDFNFINSWIAKENKF